MKNMKRPFVLDGSASNDFPIQLGESVLVIYSAFPRVLYHLVSKPMGLLYNVYIFIE